MVKTMAYKAVDNRVIDISCFSAKRYESAHDKTNKMGYVPSKDADQPGHLPSLIRVFAVHSLGS